ncbi:MAG: dihydrodipicolinate synthase family protein [Alphaproteobacteria bacterium]
MSRLLVEDLPADIRTGIARGLAIPAHPLALDAGRELDRRRQCALTRYYIDAGAGGLAVGVHTTQFAIRERGLYEPVLRLAAETVDWWADRPLAMIAGVAGRTEQALSEAEIAVDLGYHAVLVSPAAFRDASEDDLLAHCRAIGEVAPLVGFYLQPAVGGRVLSAEFWRRFAEIEAVVAIKIAPFNRYATMDVVRGIVEAGAEDRVALYTGNDDHIVGDLLTTFTAVRAGEPVSLRIAGGLLGHWSVWTKTAVDLHRRCRAVTAEIPADLLGLDSQVTDMNGAVFDVANNFHGVIAGCHEVLRAQGLLQGTWCLDPDEALSPGQAQEIARVSAAYPHLTDDEFVADNRERWLA